VVPQFEADCSGDTANAPSRRWPRGNGGTATHNDRSLSDNVGSTGMKNSKDSKKNKNKKGGQRPSYKHGLAKNSGCTPRTKSAVSRVLT